MDYQDFKENIINAVVDFYGKDAEVRMEECVKNNGKRYDGICIMHKDASEDKEIIPVIYLDIIYEKYVSGELEMEECIGMVIDLREREPIQENTRRFAENITDWEKVRHSIYPMLLSTEENRELLENLVTEPFLDLSIIYIVRGSIDNKGVVSTKITKALLGCYEITAEKLHQQALSNLEMDGYTFWNMKNLLNTFSGENAGEYTDSLEMEEGRMYILTNTSKMYGAAGILSKRLLKEQLGSQDCYILPSSVHETIFIPASEKMNQEYLDSMVCEVNEMLVGQEERLCNHSYYYDAQKKEIRITA